MMELPIVPSVLFLHSQILQNDCLLFMFLFYLFHLCLSGWLSNRYWKWKLQGQWFECSSWCCFSRCRWGRRCGLGGRLMRTFSLNSKVRTHTAIMLFCKIMYPKSLEFHSAIFYFRCTKYNFCWRVIYSTSSSYTLIS